MADVSIASVLRELAEKHEDITTVLYIDEDHGDRPVRVSDLLRADADEIEREARRG